MSIYVVTKLNENVVQLAVTKKGRLAILYDDFSENPRNWENLGTMICWHSRYNLGDTHDYGSPVDFLRDMALEVYESVDLEWLNQKVDAEFKDVVIYQNDDGEWVFEYDDYTYYAETHEKIQKRLQHEKDLFIEYLIQYSLSMDELLDIIKTKVLILPVYMYEHSGIALNTTGFSCPWDSGQVGWIYATYERIGKEYGIVNDNTITKAKKTLKAEVEIYSHYLNGDVYGFIYEKFDTEALEAYLKENELEFDEVNASKLNEFVINEDSCWGFYGWDFKENGLAECAPAELMEVLDYVTK